MQLIFFISFSSFIHNMGAVFVNDLYQLAKHIFRVSQD